MEDAVVAKSSDIVDKTCHGELAVRIGHYTLSYMDYNEEASRENRELVVPWTHSNLQKEAHPYDIDDREKQHVDQMGLVVQRVQLD